jgi:multidrug resistance protein
MSDDLAGAAQAVTAQPVKGSPLLPIFLIVLVDVLGLTIILPLLPFYAVNLGATATVVGLLISSYALCQLIAGPILGRWSDQVGRKPVLIVSQLGTLVGFLILAFAHQLWLVFLSRVIDGLTAGNLSIAQAYIADVTTPENRAKSFGVIGIAFGIGFLVGPGISGFLSQYGYSYPILAAAFLSASSVVCTATLLPKAEPHAGQDAGPAGRRLSVFNFKAYGEYFARPDLGPLLWQFFFFAFFFSLSMSGFALFANARYQWHGKPVGAREVGYLFMYVGFLGVILQGGLIGRLVKWLGERTLVWTGFAVTAVTNTWLAWVFTIPQLLANMTLGSYGSGVLRPAITAMITHKAGKREQGVVLGLTQSLTSISQIVAPVIAGSLIDAHHTGGWALSVAFVALMGMIVSLRTRAT